MSDKYFDKFPLISYSNNVVVNITERAKILNGVMANPYVFYPLDINNGLRPDQVAYNIYNDQFKSWIVYLSNDIIDPYYQWYLQNDDFNEYLKKKYNVGSIYTLQQKVAFYRNNWYNSDNISVAAFNALDTNAYIYWEPVYGNTNVPMYYQRVQQDWTINTNQLVQYTVNTTSTFIKDEVVNISLYPGYLGNGQVVTSNSTNITIQHTSGYIDMSLIVADIQPNNNKVFLQSENDSTVLYADEANELLVLEDPQVSTSSYIRGTESSSNTSILSSKIIQTNIDPSVASYWSPVYVYDMENEKNEYNKSIRVLDPSYSTQVSQELKNILA
jgi:Base plate wedge protein 53